MAMASWMFRGRTLLSGRSIRSRHDSEDDVQLDFSKDATENAREILSYICKKQGLTEGKRFSYLNALIKLVTKSDVWAGGLGYSVEELQCCLRVALVHEASQVRAAALRAIRYLLKEEKDVRILNKLRYPCLISRSLDLMLKNEAERIQALRLVRRMLVLAPIDFPISLARSLVSLANGAAEGKDRMLRSCLATLAEICVLNPEMFILCGGVSAVIRNLLECQMPRITESLCGVLLFLLNSPATRSKAGICLQSLAAPYCDFHLNSDRNRDEREVQFHCSRLALLSVLRSWPGLLHFCHPANSSGLRSIVNVLYLKQLEVRKGILDLLYELLGLPQPEWTDEFSVALEAVDPSHPRDAWKLQEGFVSAEGRDILPHLARFRPNIVEIHLALLLYTFLQAGLLEAIVEVIVSSDTFISVRATVLLGELLHLIHHLLPPECCNLTPALPNLLSHASNASLPSVQHQALAAVAILSHLHAMLKRRPAPASLFLDRTLQGGGWGREESKAGKRSKLYTFVAPKEGDDLLKDSAVLTHKDGFYWNWNVVRAVLKSRSESLKKLEDSNHRTFLKRLVYYFKPSSNRFSRFELGNKKQTQMYTLAGLELIDCLLEVEEAEGGKLLNELLADIWLQIDAITSSKSAHDCLFSPQHVSNSLCQNYFMFIGRLCRCSKGLRMLDKAGIFQQLLHLVVSTNHDCYVKLVVSGLDYSMDGMARVILSKVLTAPSESSRLYATQFLLVLLRARLPDFQKWGIELLVMQLYDQSKAVSLAAIAILGEATEEKIYLDAVISLRPSLLHLGDKGLLLLIRFLSTPNGFTFLQDANFVTTQLERWASNYNYRYVRLVEGDIHDSLTLHQCNEDGRYSRRVTSTKHYVRDVFIPPHLYGQLVQHEKGFQLLVKEGKLHNLFQCVHNGRCSSELEILELKAALWGCGHVATSPLGISLLAEHGVVRAVLQLAQHCSVYSVRGTAFYMLGLVATTFEGANILSRAGWLCVRHHRHDRWPVITDDEGEDDVTSSDAELFQQSGFNADGDGISCCSQVLSGWDSNCNSVTQQRPSTVDSTQESNPGHFYIPGDDDDDDVVDVHSIGSGDDEGFHLEETVNSTKWSDMSESNVDDTEQQRKSRTLPHLRHHSVPTAPFPHRHFRSLSECKQTQVQALPNATLGQAGDWALGPSRTRKDSSRGEQVSKSRCNSCTDSSGVSSCDSGLGPTGKHGGPHEQTLSPIPSSTSLNTLRSGAVTDQAIGNQVSYRKLSSIHGSGTSSLTSPDTSSCRLSQQDMLGYATLRCLHRYRRPLYSDTVSLAAMELLVFDDHRHIPPSSHSSSVSRALKVCSLDRQYAHPGMCEFEASLPPQLLSGSSSISLAARTYIGSRSNLAAARHSGLVSAGSSTQQCYMGICLPLDLAILYPRDELATRAANVKERGRQRGNSERRRSTSLGEMEDLQEAGEEDTDTSFSSDSEDLESQMKTHHSDGAASDYRHSSTNCLACCRLRDRKISASSYHRHRTDTESSYGGGESPVLFPRRRKSHSASSCLLGHTPGASVESGNSTSLDIGPCHQRVPEVAGTPSKALIRREILKHVMRMSNPVWIKLSKQTLLQLKQQYPVVFQDVCLYSEVSHRMGSATYRLSARRFLQELFLDLQFDALYEEPAVILQILQSVADSTNAAAIASPQSTGHSPASLSTSPNLPNVSNNQDTTDGLSLNNRAQPHGNVTSVEQPVSPTRNPSEVTGVTNSCQECFITTEEKPPISENTRVGVTTETVSLDTVPPPKVTVQQGVYPVKSPPLEVVTEEPVTSVSCLDTLSVADNSKSNLVLDHFPVGSTSEKLAGVSDLVIASTRNEMLNSAAQAVDGSHNNSLLFSSATQSTADFKNPSISNSIWNTKSHTLSSDVENIPSAEVMTEQTVRGDGEESIYSFIVGEHERTNCEESFVLTSKIQEEAGAENCVVPNIAEKVGSYDILVTELECQESGNLNLSNQNSCKVSQNSSGGAVSAVPSVSGVMSHLVIKRIGKVPETENKHHEGKLGAHVQKNAANCVSQSAPLYLNSPSTTAISSPKSESVLKDSSVCLSTSSPKPGTRGQSTESAVSGVKAVLDLPEQSVPHHSQSLMPSQSQAATANAGATSFNTNSHAGALSSLDSSARISQNKQILQTVLNEDLTSSFEMFPEMQSSIFTVTFPETRIVHSTDSMTRSDPEYKDAKSRVPTKAAVIGTRHRKMATACPPNISSLTKIVTKTVPATAESKTVQSRVIQMSQEENL